MGRKDDEFGESFECCESPETIQLRRYATMRAYSKHTMAVIVLGINDSEGPRLLWDMLSRGQCLRGRENCGQGLVELAG
jgi:hypothetical protein